MSPRLVGRAWMADACAEIARAVAAGEAELALELHAYVRARIRESERLRRPCAVRGCPSAQLGARRCTRHQKRDTNRDASGRFARRDDW